jgi:hypothetical protein
MPDVRLDAISDDLDDLQSQWTALVVAAKASADPRACVSLLDAGVLSLTALVIELHASILRLPTKDIAIDLHTPAS